MRLTAREEIVIELYRALDLEQRNDLVKRTRALVHANRIIQSKLKGPLKLVGDPRVEAKYGLPTPVGAKRKLPSRITKPQPRRPDRAQDDSTPEN